MYEYYGTGGSDLSFNFGEAYEEKEMNLNFSIDVQIAELIESLAQEEGKTISETVKEILISYYSE